MSSRIYTNYCITNTAPSSTTTPGPSSYQVFSLDLCVADWDAGTFQRTLPFKQPGLQTAELWILESRNPIGACVCAARSCYLVGGGAVAVITDSGREDDYSEAPLT